MADRDRWNEDRGRYGAEDRIRRGYRDYPASDYGGGYDFDDGSDYRREARAFDDRQFNTGRSYGDDGYGRHDEAYGPSGGPRGEPERDRNWVERAGDRIGSWFGGDGGRHRGRGPKNYSRSDDRIREDVNDRLTDDTWLDASEIEVLVKACEVTLSGTVAGREEKRRAEDIAEQVRGVTHVQNNLRVVPQGGTAQTGETRAFASTLTSRPLEGETSALTDKSAGNA